MPEETNQPRQPGEPSTNKPAPVEVPVGIDLPSTAKATKKAMEE